ncbi:hypothetical protein MCAP1_001797 [Malassezia caprae]|uniref:Uncharacterized protein n=1 Tax=Malassezia caprae TaxID=1381934 RepID=A0AAF0E8I4_9BASI|nr:hypothetical protein MCAP1_001797 [Malassezia caprae]
MWRVHALEPLEPTPRAALQDVHLDLGDERASVQWHMVVPVPPSSGPREYALWDAPLVELVHAQVDAHEDLDAQMRVESHGSSVIRCPVLLCDDSTLHCRFYAYDKPMYVRAKHPEHIHSAKWVEQDPTPLWCAHFFSMSELVLEWMPALAEGEVHELQAHTALADCHLSPRLTVAETLLDSYTEVDVDFSVRLIDPFTCSPHDTVPITCSLSSGHPGSEWRSLVCDCSPDQARMATDGHTGLVPYRLGPATTSQRTFTLSVYTQRVCGGFGEPPQGLAFHVYGRVRVVHGADATLAWTGMPSLTLDAVQLSPLYYIHDASDPSYVLQMRASEDAQWRPATQEPVRAIAALRWAPAPCALPAPVPPAALMHATAGYHEVWAHARSGRVEHCVHLHAGPLAHGTYELCRWPWAPAHLAVFANGHRIPARLHVQPNTATLIDAPSASPPVWHRVHCVLATPGHTHLVLRYSTPFPLDTVTLPAFPQRFPIFLLRVNGTETQQARFHPGVHAHVTYGEAALATWFDMDPNELVQVPVQWVPGAQRANTCILALGILGTTALLLALAAMYAIHTTSEHLLLRTDMLAMALDINFSDGAWLPTPPARASSLSLVVSWLQAPWVVPP